MRIKSIQAFGVKYRFGKESAYGMSRGVVSERGSTLVKIETDEGITGLGEIWGNGEYIIEYIRSLSSFYINQDPFDREILLIKTYDQLYHLGKSGVFVSILSGIDMALWDIIGKATGQPVYKLLGGKSRDKIMAYASSGYITLNSPLESLARQAEQAAEQGYHAIKIKIGVNPEQDRERVRLTRDIVGKDVLILIDANGNYKRDSALKCARLVEEFDIHWFEEPVPPEDLAGYEFLKQNTAIPLAAGEALFTRYDFRPYIERGLVDYVQPDLTKTGGLTEAKAISELAVTYNLNVSAHVWGTGVGLAAGLHYMAFLPAHPHTLFEPSPILFEYDISFNPLRNELVQEPVLPLGGYLTVPNRPGLGVELNEEFLKKCKKEGQCYVLTE